MPRKKMQFLQKPSCTSCRKSKAYLESRGVELQLRDLDTERLSVDELESLIGSRDYRLFLNTRNEMYRTGKMKENPPSRKEAIKLMAAHPNLIRRPVVISGKRLALGYDEKAYEELLQ